MIDQGLSLSVLYTVAISIGTYSLPLSDKFPGVTAAWVEYTKVNIYELLDQELILLLFLLGWHSSKSLGSIISKQIRMTFGRIVLPGHRSAESDFWCDVTLLKWWQWRHFMHKSAAIQWVRTHCLHSTRSCWLAASNSIYSYSSWSVVHSNLLQQTLY